ncbi:hypothetical protein PILCRDRAFT_829296 [Piloderma croceum F 1598]|uniref:Uncharacterized protein n=1 Tax=Piloderma croceum (strain F 1598) TaxID=765440 RepID=A0A0C3EL07_PILCF|nr:hypothetical protein PILCRDRAFT_829296 [Piloderma croceum F 1598]
MNIPRAFVRDLVRPLMVVFDPSYNFSIPSVIKTSRGRLGLALRAIGGPQWLYSAAHSKLSGL